jgi:pimeloyl-ACP methyl ester carboxylesterase
VIAAGAIAVAALAGCGSKAPPPQTYHGLVEEWGMPSDGHPRALMLLIPGGGWRATGATQIANQLTGLGANLRKLGYETLAFGYRGGAQSIRDAQMFYDLARRRVGPRLPICAIGPSAGGHIALMLAVKNPDLACVVDFAGPTDLSALAHEPNGTAGYHHAVKTFGTRRLAAYSPALHASSIRARVLLMYAQNDPIVPVDQGTVMAQALPGAQLIELPPGPTPFVHSAVAQGPYYKALANTETFIARAVSSAQR